MALRSLSSSSPPSDDPKRAQATSQTDEPKVFAPVDAEERPPARPVRLGWRSRIAPPVAVAVIVLLIWQALTASGAVSTFLLPTPAEVARSFWSNLTNGLLVRYAVPTIEESLLGFALATVVAVPLGYVVARSRLLSHALEPYLAASQALPAVALAPLLALWLPYGLPPVIALCALIVFFPTLVNTTLGLRTLDRDVLDAGRVDGANAWALLRSIELPLALPSILAGMRTSLTLAVTGAVVGEFVVGDQGLGGLLNIARGEFDTALVFAVLLTLALIAAVLYTLARLAERRVSYLEA